MKMFRLVFGLAFLIFGIVMFVQIGASQREYVARMQRIRAGEVPPEVLTVAGKYINTGRHGSHPHIVCSSSRQTKIVLSPPQMLYDTAKPGDTLTGYYFPDGYLVPGWRGGDADLAKWGFLGFGILPGGAILAYAFARPMRRENSRPDSAGKMMPNESLQPTRDSAFNGNFPFNLDLERLKAATNPAAAGPPPRAEKPWLARADWAAGKIKSSADAALKPYFMMALVCCGMGALFIFFVIPKELHKGNYHTLPILILSAMGVFFLLYTLQQRRGLRRYGETSFVMTSVPGAPGGALEGSIQTGAPLRPEQGLRLRLSCIRRVTCGKNNREDILWQDERILKNDAVSAQSGHAVIPVYFQLPASQPECFEHGFEAIIWRLEAKAKVSGPDFNAVFDVPVFNVASAAAAQAAEPDTTAALQMPIEEVRRDEHSKIQIRNAPGGREFFFPAARNLGVAFVLTVFMLFWSVVVCFLFHVKAPWLFRVVFGLADVFLVHGCLNLWFKQSRVTFYSRGVRVAKHWLIFGRTRSFDTSNVARFDSKVGFTAGQQLYYDIELITRTEKKITVGTGIASKPEADWLAREMNGALGHSA
jgi:hypothetical protein